MKTIAPFLVFIAVAMLTGCYNNEVKRDPAFAAVRPAPIEPQDNYDGAIFDARNNISLFEDYRARRVGDILTVKLEEKTDAEKETETTVDKSNNNSIDNPTLFGTTPQFNLPGQLPLANTKDNNLAFGVNSTSKFKGAGDSDQNNKLTGNISVSVVEVLPNGNMVIRGERVITINQGNEYIRLSGMISPRDIEADNSISSIRIADAQISYVGDGPTNDANVMGWLSRFFVSALMPF
ncbi:MAG TPA: flagellar basal body L-ring protein FlgH [Methylophaga aminisulfidivorans]|jgi:flagellar L-ring protein FlgH|uniref:Flagellar L-ring protein n=2 Tax=Methylophaga TaxID=40222 RepID=F5SZV6_9GAMM|nr:MULTISPECIES: flagellar basal body L-ring protein FlgH [Methylophaga]EGL54706.1 flagellar basal body L-ring protein [Methylophaga aminisulfidivorans MP]GLQ01054.1 flagellar L-ring protein [Methylophaga thalassica]HIC47360.1 flagellar basal body L-ring protein FlgH [Methylophaga sp.]HIM38728.1 flagellar basal body L-ring protein FlgH [Methylophaga aminisulfidivorans]